MLGHDERSPADVLDLLARQAWMSAAACRGRGHLFFPPLAERPQARVKREMQARAVCDACPVATPCQRYARENREYGFWGGESETSRAIAGFPPPNPIGLRSRRPGDEGPRSGPAELHEAS
jgi:WhiB family transcriptional regulator, redox-sensing transcriptional regulator